MPQYRKKPVIVEATQWFPGDKVEGVTMYPVTGAGGGREAQYSVVTIHGQETFIERGDYIITEPDGIHHYPCKPDIFEKNYEKV